MDHLAQPAPLSIRLARFFFMHLGSFVAVFLYFYLCGKSDFALAGVVAALPIGLLVMIGYIVLAYWADELKYFDFGLLLMFTLGTLSAYTNFTPILTLFQRYSPAVLFFTLGSVALIPLLLGRETFTYYFARRQTPPWQQKLPEFPVINRVMTGFWAVIFFVSAGLAAYQPLDWRFNTLYPNILVFIIGVPAAFWLPPLYLKIFPPGFPQTIEALLLGMPWAFNRKAAGDTRAVIQFHISGAAAGAYYLQIANGKCESKEGVATAPDLTVYTSDTVWMRIVRKELDGAQALQDGLYRVEGDLPLLLKMSEWFLGQPGTS
jgi:putative sterol carrier protein